MARRKSSHPHHIKAAFIIVFLLVATIASVALSGMNLSITNKAAEPMITPAIPGEINGRVLNVGPDRPSVCPASGYWGLNDIIITLTNTSTSQRYTTRSKFDGTNSGFFGFNNLPNGQYKVCASLAATSRYQFYCTTQSDPSRDPFTVSCNVITLNDNGDNSTRFVMKDTFLPTSTPVPPVKRVFITSTQYTGNLGGLAGADAKCQERADAVGLGGHWRAWLSDSHTSAASRLNHSVGIYRQLPPYSYDIANNWADLTDGMIISPIDVSEIGNTPINYVWTNTLEDGSIANHDPSSTCNDWTSTNNATMIGHHNSISREWTQYSTQNCDFPSSLYCFEQ